MVSASEKSLNGAVEGTPLYLVYQDAWSVTMDGRKLGPEDFEPLLQRLQHGMELIQTLDDKIVGNAFEKAGVVTVEGQNALVTDVGTNDNRFMWSISPNAAADETEKKAALAARKEIVVQEDEDQLSISMTAEDVTNSKKVKRTKHEGGTSSPSLDNLRNINGGGGYTWVPGKVSRLSVSVLRAWNATKEEGVGDNLWFIYLLNELLGLVLILSDGQLNPTLASIMSFNTASENKPEDQALHLDIDPKELYPDLVKDESDEEGFFVPLHAKATLERQLATLKTSYFPSVFLYFVAFDHKHAIKVYDRYHGTDVLYHTTETAPSKYSIANDAITQIESYLKGVKDSSLQLKLNGLNTITQYYIKRVGFPFGSLGVVAGSVIHCGVGSDEHKSKPRFRLHSFCHVKGQHTNLKSVYDTYIWQKD